MFINDPSELALEPKLEGWDQVNEEETEPDYDEIFHSESHFIPGNLPYHNSFAVDMCRFDENGNHAQMGKNCPHYEQTDEEGPRITPGWTIQQNRR
jgi:hypothetical protein